MHCFKQSLRAVPSSAYFTYGLLHAAGAFRRGRCVEVVLGELHGKWPDDLECFGSLEPVLCRAILDAVHGEPGCADGRIIRNLLRTGAKNMKYFKGFGLYDTPNGGPFRGGWFGWEPFRFAFVERQQDREQRETPTCMEMRDAVLDCLSIPGKMNAHNNLVGEASKGLFQASYRRLIRRWADKREGGQGTGGGSSCEESSDGGATSSSGSGSSGYAF